jgi:hypothetical protein
MAAFASIVGGFAGAVIGGYSGYVQGVAAYGLEGMEDNSANISAVLWAIIGSAAGSVPGFYLAKRYGVAGFGIGALQGAVDAALGGTDPIESAIHGIVSGIIGAGVGTTIGLLNKTGWLCSFIAKKPKLAFITTSVVTGWGVYSGIQGVRESLSKGNDLQTLFRMTFTLVDIVSVLKSLTYCFEGDTIVLQGSNSESVMIYIADSESNTGEIQNNSMVVHLISGMVSVVICGVIMFTRQNKREDEIRKDVSNHKLNHQNRLP